MNPIDEINLKFSKILKEEGKLLLPEKSFSTRRREWAAEIMTKHDLEVNEETISEFIFYCDNKNKDKSDE